MNLCTFLHVATDGTCRLFPTVNKFKNTAINTLVYLLFYTHAIISIRLIPQDVFFFFLSWCVCVCVEGDHVIQRNRTSAARSSGFKTHLCCLPAVWPYTDYLTFTGFPCGSAGKESARNAGGLGLIPGLGRSPGEGNGYQLQYSGLENSMDCIVHGITKSWTQLSNFHFTSLHF